MPKPGRRTRPAFPFALRDLLGEDDRGCFPDPPGRGDRGCLPDPPGQDQRGCLPDTPTPRRLQPPTPRRPR